MKRFNEKINGILRILVFSLLFGISAVINFGCGSYSFTGASVPAHLKTIAIPIAEDKSPAAIPGLRELLTDDLIQKFISDNSLQVTERSTANATLECVASRRLTIIVKVVYKDLIQRKTIFESTFTNHGDYVPGEATNERENAVAIAVDKISEDILLAVVSGW
ncbi:MAG: hypothetical protein HUU44_06745 [Ignavibacteriaceae bacterium]|nr:hypothetical protein [Ignavibacteriaceae bacterium]